MILQTTAHVRSITLFLRALGVFIFLNGVSVLLPERWIDSVLVWCGIGHLPDAVLFHYLLRGSGALLVSFGVLIWVIASDVVRYRPIVMTLISIFLVCAPVSYWIGAVVGLPRWWCALDAAICVLGGGIPLVFCLLHSQTSSTIRLQARPGLRFCLYSYIICPACRSRSVRRLRLAQAIERTSHEG